MAISDKVIFEGFQNDIPTLMNQSDLVVISSHSEGFSVVMVEAFFYAPLFLSTKVSGATEILEEAFLMEHADMQAKIEAIFKDYATYQAQFDALRFRIQPLLTLQNTVAQYRAYYETSLKEAP